MEKQRLDTLFAPEADLQMTRAASFSELTETKKILLGQHRFQEELSNNPLPRQHSSEQIQDLLRQSSRLKEKTKKTELMGDKKSQDMLWNKSPAASHSNLMMPSDVSLHKKLHLDTPRENKFDCVEESDHLKMPSFKSPQVNKTLERSKSNDYIFGVQPNFSELHENVQRQSIHRPKARKPLTLSKFMALDEYNSGLKNFGEAPSTISSAPATPVMPILAMKDPAEAMRYQHKSKAPTKTAAEEPVDSEMTGRTNWCWPALFFSLLPVAFIFLNAALNQEDLVNQFCSPAMNFSTSIREELGRRVYGQEQAVAQISRFLENRYQQSGFSVLALVGATGVGKSYTAKLLRENMAGKHLALEYFPPLLDKELEAYETLYTCGCNLLILDNLKSKNLEESAGFCHDLKKRATNYCVLVLAIFNTQKINDSLKKNIDLHASAESIMASFNEKQMDVEVVRYENLQDEALEKCILEVEKTLGVQLSDKDRQYILQGLHLAQSGCKGAYSKVQLFVKHLE